MLKHVGYEVDGRAGSHIKMKALTFKSKTKEDILTVQAHNPLLIKSVDKTLKKASEQTGIPLKTLKQMLDDF